MSCRDSGWWWLGVGFVMERSRGRCWWDSQWWCSVAASVVLWDRGRFCLGLADSRALCLGLFSLWGWTGFLRRVICAGACGDLNGGAVRQRGSLGFRDRSRRRIVLFRLRGEVQGAGKFDGAERGARRDEVDLVFVGAGEQWDRGWCGLPGAAEENGASAMITHFKVTFSQRVCTSSPQTPWSSHSPPEARAWTCNCCWVWARRQTLAAASCFHCLSTQNTRS